MPFQTVWQMVLWHAALLPDLEAFVIREGKQSHIKYILEIPVIFHHCSHNFAEVEVGTSAWVLSCCSNYRLDKVTMWHVQLPSGCMKKDQFLKICKTNLWVELGCVGLVWFKYAVIKDSHVRKLNLFPTYLQMQSLQLVIMPLKCILSLVFFTLND